MTHPSSLRIVHSSKFKKFKEPDYTKHRVGIMSASAGTSGLIDVIDTFDRPGLATAEGAYAEAGTYAKGFTNKPMQRIPKAGAYAGAGVGRARAEFSVFEAEAKGPNASAGAQASLSDGVSAMARAEVGSASAAAGPVKVKAGLGLDTGASIGPEGVEVQVLGTGVKLGSKAKVSLLGSSVECSVL